MMLSLKEVAEQLGTTITQVRYIVKKKLVPFLRIGKAKVFIDQNDVDLVKRRLEKGKNEEE